LTILELENRVSEYRQVYMRVMMSVTSGLMINSRGNVIEVIRSKVKGLNTPGHLRWSPLKNAMNSGDQCHSIEIISLRKLILHHNP